MLRRVLILAFAGLVAFAVSAVAARAAFSDVPKDHWAYEAVQYLQDQGLAVGYPDGTYKGDKLLSRFEFAMIVSRLLEQLEGEDEEGGGQPPIDVEAVLEMLEEEFAPELKELREMINANTEKIGVVEKNVDTLSTQVTDLTAKVSGMGKGAHLSGDLRFRFEGIYPDKGLQTQRPRYRLRVGFTQPITPELKFGARFASGKAGDITSTNRTIDDAFGIDPATIDLAYMQWTPEAYPGFTAWGGKFMPPWVTTPMVWDSDVTVEGIAQNYNINNFHMYLGEIVPTVEGFYIVAQIGADDLFVKGLSGAVTYHYINTDAWTHIRADMQSGKLDSMWNFDRLQSPEDYRAIEAYGAYSHKVGNVPVKIEGNYLQNQEKTATGLLKDAGWQKAAWARLTVKNKVMDPGDWNAWGEWGRIQPNSVLGWLTDADRGKGDSEWWGLGWNYRLMKNTDFNLTYFNREKLSTQSLKTDIVQVDVNTRF